MNADELGGKWKIRHKKSSFLIPFGDQIVSIERDRPFALEFWTKKSAFSPATVVFEN